MLSGKRSLLGGAVGVFVLALTAGLAPSAMAATGGNFVATGHDMDFHCSGGDTDECAYLKIVVDKIRNGSSLPILALDQGSELPDALANAGYTAPGEVVTVDPSNTSLFDATPFTDPSGHPLYSAIITASDSTCGGCDDDASGEGNINARASDFATYFNAGGGILALAGADNYATYYNFVPLSVAATVVAPPFTVTSDGASLGITDAMVNCCPTHNSFSPPPSPFVTLENDTSGNAETIAAFNATIGKGGFSSGDPTSLTVNSAAGDYADATTVSAVLMDTATSKPVSGETVTFHLNGSETCSGTTDASGKASCSLTPHEAAGTYTLTASFAGDSSYQASSGSASFTVHLEQTSLVYTGQTSATRGGPVKMRAKLTTDDPAAGTPMGGRKVSFTYGTGSTAQSCSATTNSSGVATCTIAKSKQGSGSVSVTAHYAGNSHYQAATATSTTAVKAASVAAKLSSVPTACVSSAFTARVQGKRIAFVTFLLDGVRKPGRTVAKGKQYSATISVRPGHHTLTVKVRFRKGSAATSRTFRRTVTGCSAPPFTG